MTISHRLWPVFCRGAMHRYDCRIGEETSQTVQADGACSFQFENPSLEGFIHTSRIRVTGDLLSFHRAPTTPRQRCCPSFDKFRSARLIIFLDCIRSPIHTSKPSLPANYSVLVPHLSSFCHAFFATRASVHCDVLASANECRMSTTVDNAK